VMQPTAAACSTVRPAAPLGRSPSSASASVPVPVPVPASEAQPIGHAPDG
jgi:hypothetical protein